MKIVFFWRKQLPIMIFAMQLCTDYLSKKDCHHRKSFIFGALSTETKLSIVLIDNCEFRFHFRSTKQKNVGDSFSTFIG